MIVEQDDLATLHRKVLAQRHHAIASPAFSGTVLEIDNIFAVESDVVVAVLLHDFRLDFLWTPASGGLSETVPGLADQSPILLVVGSGTLGVPSASRCAASFRRKSISSSVFPLLDLHDGPVVGAELTDDGTAENSRTGSSSRSAGTATKCDDAPMSMPAAFGSINLSPFELFFRALRLLLQFFRCAMIASSSRDVRGMSLEAGRR